MVPFAVLRHRTLPPPVKTAMPLPKFVLLQFYFIFIAVVWAA